ncbi:MAG: pyridoxamine 5'-phosphate oxidase family protein [Sporichthyaceae bacterium]
MSERVRRVSHVLSLEDPAVLEFWRERHLCTLATLRADGRPHVVPVGATLDPEHGLARVIASRSSLKIRHVAAAGAAGAAVAICQVDGRRWATIEGTATAAEDRESVAEAERRYALRYRAPRENPERVVLLVRIDRMLGNI